jgi:glycogen synthase
MATLYTTAAVLLFPSHYEGFGLPVLEAQMCGTPVVCSDRGALPEVAVSRDNSQLLAPYEVDHLAQATCNAETRATGAPTSYNHSVTPAHWAAEHAALYETSPSEQLPVTIERTELSYKSH